MTADEFKIICEREWANGFGVVTELHLDSAAYKELCLDVTTSATQKISGIVNPVTSGVVSVTLHENHALVIRPPHPAETVHKVAL